MLEPPRSPSPPPRPTLPWVLFAAAALAAVAAATGFVYLLAKRTEGPAQVLGRFYQGVHNGDCEASYELLSADYLGSFHGIEPDEWCQAISGETGYPPSFRVDEIRLVDDVAQVRVREPDEGLVTWRLRRDGRTWRIVEFPPERRLLPAD